MVSTDFILSQLQEAKDNSDIVKLEFEDLQERCTAEIASAIQDLLTCDARPWEDVHFVDEVTIDGTMGCFPSLNWKNSSVRDLRTVCKLKFIPISFYTKLNITDTTQHPCPEAQANVAPSLTPNDTVATLRHVRKYKSVMFLNLKTSDITVTIIQELISLLQYDNRKWESIKLQLSGTGPYKAGTQEHASWREAMEACCNEMQAVAKERGIRML
jgi:hypothetical protein